MEVAKKGNVSLLFSLSLSRRPFLTLSVAVAAVISFSFFLFFYDAPPPSCVSVPPPPFLLVI